ncbi:MAG: 2-phosphosulfolactate phosphatase [Gemmatimonadota bacterium]|nr:MAG: 2-phosphosulfolactate phosphatase [Gemmatimonadota bacterium]
MKLNVFFTPLGVATQPIAGKPTLVLDVLRFTTTTVAAMANGARAVVPAASSDEALRLAQNLAPQDVLLGGERGCKPIEGFHLGNSPAEMTADVVAGKTLVMSTTNGTRAFMAVESARPVLIAAITNFSAVVERARKEVDLHGEITILCAGRRELFAFEDAYVAGRFADALIPSKARKGAELNDAAIAALELGRHYGDKWRRAVSSSSAAGDLKRLGYKKDLDVATEVDSHSVVPIYSNRIITLHDTE